MLVPPIQIITVTALAENIFRPQSNIPIAISKSLRGFEIFVIPNGCEESCVTASIKARFLGRYTPSKWHPVEQKT